MPVEYVVIEKDAEQTARGFRYTSSVPALRNVRRKCILHVRGGDPPRITHQVYLVEGTREQIDAVTAHSKCVEHYSTMQQMQLRGLQVKPGTLTDSDIDEFLSYLQTELGVDLGALITPWSSPLTLEEWLKANTPSIPEGEEGWTRPFDVVSWK
jgi:hypothetical protein